MYVESVCLMTMCEEKLIIQNIYFFFYSFKDNCKINWNLHNLYFDQYGISFYDYGFIYGAKEFVFLEVLCFDPL